MSVETGQEFLDASAALRAAELAQKSGLIATSALQLSPLVERLWREGLPPGERTGWPSMDRHYSVVPGQLTILTGWPGSGKSEWLDALLLNLAKQDWRLALFSPENMPAELHVAKYVEKFLGKPFGHGPTERATAEEVREAMVEINDRFGFLLPDATTDRITFGIDDILEAAELHFRLQKRWKVKGAKCGLVIDPWNEIEHRQPSHMSETQYISDTLTRIRMWARAASIHVWIVAHPQKLKRDDGGKLPVPRPDAISGSQHWWNKADNCITVFRELGEKASQNVEIHVQKVRFKHVGMPGVVDLTYDRVTGRYHEPLRVAYDRMKGRSYDD